MKALLLILLLGQAVAPLSEQDRLRVVLDEMKQAECCRLEFVSIVESDIFDAIDSTAGEALVAADGRYWVKLGTDEYWQTEDLLYSYSLENNQVTLERSVAAPGSIEEISFITRLEEYFDIQPITVGAKYLLANKTPDESQLPAQMTLRLDNKSGELAALEYRDMNGELNRILFLSQASTDSCDTDMLTPNLPDTVETIRLP